MSTQVELFPKIDNAPKNGKSCNRMAEVRQVYAAFVVNILSICNGISAGWTSPVQPLLRSSNNPIRTRAITEETFSWASSILYLGGLLGTFVWKEVADWFGRKVSGYAIAGTQIISWLGIMMAQSPIDLIMARFMMGIGGAGIIVHSQLYTSEIANSQLKGPLCALITINMNAGLLLVSVLGYYCSYGVLNFVCFLIPILFCILFFWLPESPLYLLASDRDSEAREALMWYRRSEQNVITEICKLRENVNRDHKNVPYSELVKNKTNLKVTLTATMLLAGQQLSGRPVMLAYLVDLFSSTRTSVSPHVSSIIVNILQVVVACSSNFVTRSIGGKCLLCLTYIGMSVSCAILSLFNFVSPEPGLGFIRWVPTMSMIVFLVCCNLGVLPVPFMMLPHMFPAYILNNGLSISLLASIFTSFATVKLFPAIKMVLGNAGSIFIFAGFNLMLALFVAVYVREPEKMRESRRNVDSS